MRVAQRLDYTLRLLAGLARLPEGYRVAIGDLALALELPKRFSEQQITELAREGFVSCQRGVGGGCRLERSADEITVAAVVRALEGGVLDVPRTRGSATAEMWGRAAIALERSLDEVTIADLAQRQTELDAQEAPMYHI